MTRAALVALALMLAAPASAAPPPVGEYGSATGC